MTGDKPLADQRHQWLGMFAHVLHIRSWELGGLRVADFRDYVAWLEEFNKSEG
jgi:hypothetical protein